MESSIEAALQPLLVVDNCHRKFSIPESDISHYGFSSEKIQKLIGHNLPYIEKDNEYYFDSDDLYSLSLHLKIPSLHLLARRSWASALKNVESPQTIDLKYALAEGERTTGEVLLLTPNEKNEYVNVDVAEKLFQISLSTTGDKYLLPTSIRDFLKDTVGGIEFYMLHDAVRWNTDFIRKYSIAECGGCSKYIVEQARKYNLEARHVFGFILAAPYATSHFWAEFYIDGRWISVDPLLIRMLANSTGLNPKTWPEYRSPGSALLSLSTIEDYDDIGQPCLSAFPEKRYIHHPVITQNGIGFPGSFQVNLCNVGDAK